MDHISDTARWVAVYRAMETARPDALFRDPYAERLAGERGRAIVDELPQGRERAWTLIVRTALFDEVIAELLRDQAVDLVVNLAAGLDARPWRMALPPTLRWVDVDFPEILAYKTDMLRDERPACDYAAVAADLRDAPARQALFAELTAGASRALVMSEGLLIYLTGEQVGALARDLHARPAFRWWLLDLASPMLLAMTRAQGDWGASLSAANATFQFAPEAGTQFFAPFGWREARFRSTFEEAFRLKRFPENAPPPALPPGTPMPSQEDMRRFSGTVLLERV